MNEEIKMGYALTREGSKKFFKLMAQPNPKAVETLRRGKETLAQLSPEDRAKFGKEPVRMVFKIKKKREKYD